MMGDAILRLAAMPITPVAVPIAIRQRDTIANDPSYRAGLSHIEHDHTLLEIALLHLFLRKSIPVPVTYRKQHIIRVNGFYEARARRGFATVVRRDHRFTAIKVLAEPRSRIVNEHMAGGLDHGREPLAYVQQGKPEFTFSRSRRLSV